MEMEPASPHVVDLMARGSRSRSSSGSGSSTSSPGLSIDDNDDVGINDLARQANDFLQLSNRVGRRRTVPAGAMVIDVEEMEAKREADEREAEEGFLKSVGRLIDLDDGNDKDEDHGAPRRDQPADPVEPIPEYETPSGLSIRPHMTVEVKADFAVGRYKPDFVKVVGIVRNLRTRGVFIHGYVYCRARKLEGMLPPKLNEVARIIFFVDSLSDDLAQQSLFEVPIEMVIPIQRELRTTNAQFPEFRFNPKDYKKKGKRGVELDGVLVCRWFLVEHYANEIMRAKGRPCEWELRPLRQQESDAGFAVRDESKMNDWRGGKIPGGAFLPDGSDKIVVSLLGDEEENGSCGARPELSHGQKYKCGDFFSGCGGVSRGMVQAGTEVVVAVDHWDQAVASYRLNFPSTTLHDIDIHDYIQDESLTQKLDIVHLSPPCQVYSPAHTVDGRNDEKNLAALYTCTHIIKKHRPRLFTLEQTFGILHDKSYMYFCSLVLGFTSYRYSVRWTVAPFVNYGLPQPRRRLIMIGAGPGETLPTMPKPTHSSNPADGLPPPVTVRQILAELRPGIDQHHDPSSVAKCNRMPWDPKKHLPRTITCSGGENYHWSGTREFTIREFATLQGFPRDHQFAGSCIKKQIGNAFPSNVVRQLYQHLVSWLDEEDGFDAAAAARARALHKARDAGVVNLVRPRREFAGVPHDARVFSIASSNGVPARDVEMDEEDDFVEIIEVEAVDRRRRATGRASEIPMGAEVMVIDDDDDDEVAGFEVIELE